MPQSMLPRLEVTAQELRDALAVERERLVQTHPDAATEEHLRTLKKLQRKRAALAARKAKARKEKDASEREPRSADFSLLHFSSLLLQVSHLLTLPKS